MSTTTTTTIRSQLRGLVCFVTTSIALLVFNFKEQVNHDIQHRTGRQLLLDPRSISYKEHILEGGNPRKFISYQSSPWEKLWLDHVGIWHDSKQICSVLMNNQSDYMHDFLNLTCTSHYYPPHEDWCIIDDEFQPLWYNTANRSGFHVSWTRPVPISAKVDKPQPIRPTERDAHIVSRFVFQDETTGEEFVEWIEPLVSHLRFPLTHCMDPIPYDETIALKFVFFRGYIIPPPFIRNKKALYFDAGASSWSKGNGGPSLRYFFDMWRRHGTTFDEMYAFDIKTNITEFYDDAPIYYMNRIHYKEQSVSSTPEQDSLKHPFLPMFIQQHAQEHDYVLFKLDIDSPMVESGNIHYILNQSFSIIDELFWEHHIRYNDLMRPEWGPPALLPAITLRESYDLFLRLRQKGIRAHSWI